jgi:hypothetical protein
MTINNLCRVLVVQALCFLFFWVNVQAQGNCEATTLDQFYECYGGKSAFSAHSVKALTTFIQAEDAIKAGNYSQAKVLIDDLYKIYPAGNNVWWNVWTAPNGANVGTPHGYYGLRMMEDIIAYGLNPNPNVKVKKVNMNIVLVGCSKGIQPTTKSELQNGTGTFVTHSLNPKLKENNYQIIRQSLDLFTRYVKAITNGALELQIGFIEIDTLCLPVKVTTTKPYLAYDNIEPVWGALTNAAKDSTDWFMINYPSHVPDFPVFDDESFITGGMGADSKGGPVFIADDKWVTRKPAHLGKGNYTDIERRIYLPQWLQHEFFHHLYRMYPELKLEVKGHDWFDKSFWPSNFTGQFETDYYSESLHKKLQLQCTPLATKLITRIDNSVKTEFTRLSMDELVGPYSLDIIQNTWHEGNIIIENGKYYWKNKANVQWQVTPSFTEGILKTGNDCPYPGQNFFLELFRTVEGDVYPGVVSLKFGGEHYKKRFGLMRNTVPIEIALGNYERLPNTSLQHTGAMIKTQGEIVWKNNASESFTLIPTAKDEYLTTMQNSSPPNEKFQLINVNADCGVYTLGFKYMNYYYWKPKRVLTDESPQVVKAIYDVELAKGFGTHAINLPEVFTDSKGDSLLLFVTSNDTTLINAKIENQKLILTGSKEGRTTVYAMALDKNGGLAVDEFDVLVKSAVSTVETLTPKFNIYVWPSITNDIIQISGLTNNCLITLTSVINGYQESIPITEGITTIDIHHVPSGIYLIIVTDKNTGEVQWRKVVKY